MPAGVIVKETSVTAATTTANILTGSQFALITEPSVVSVGLNASATAAQISINCGNRIIMEQSTPPIDTVMPKVPDNFYWTFPALPGEIVQIAAQNTNAGGGAAVTVRAVVQIAAA